MNDSPAAAKSPQIQLYCHHPDCAAASDEVIAKWQVLSAKALPACLAAICETDAPLSTLEEIEVSLVTDEAIALVHADYLNDPTPTDVITFHHGEILVSLDTAAQQSILHGETFEREVLLYIIHGLLHLGGWDDHEEAQRVDMHLLQARILNDVWA